MEHCSYLSNPGAIINLECQKHIGKVIFVTFNMFKLCMSCMFLRLKLKFQPYV
jgi:hypothetical protein